MKKYVFFSILACMTCLFYTSCEKTGYHIQSDETLDATRILPRTVESCENCPVDYCCCSIELWGLSGVGNLSLCGFSNGDYNCGTFTPPGNCSQFHGNGEDIELSDPELIGVIVCKEENGVFRIFNNESFAVTLRITCQSDFTSPQFVVISIPAMEDVYYITNGSCELTKCMD